MSALFDIFGFKPETLCILWRCHPMPSPDVVNLVVLSMLHGCWCASTLDRFLTWIRLGMLCYQTLCFGTTICKTVHPMLSDCCMSVSLSCLSVTLVYCGQTVRCIKMKLGNEAGLGHCHIALDGDPASSPKKGHSRQFSDHVCCRQTTGWIKMPLSMEVGLSRGDILLDGDPFPPEKGGTAPPKFGPCISPNSWMDQDATWYG